MTNRRATWTVARHEYGRMVRRKSFLLATLGIPVLYIVLFAFIIFFSMKGSGKPLGYVDQAGVFPPSPQVPEEYSYLPMPVAYADVESGRQAVERGEIVALYVLPEDYLSGGEVVLYVGEQSPSQMEQAYFTDFLRFNLTAQVEDEAVRQRLLDGPSYVTKTVGTEQLSGGIYTVRIVIAVGSAVLFYLLLMLSGNYLLQAVADEKENRTVEMLITSIPPRALIVGKALGLTAVAFTQILIWSSAALLGALYYLLQPGHAHSLDLSLIPWGDLGLMLLFFIPTYFLSAAMMIALGAMVDDRQQGQQFSSILSLLFFAPLFFMAQLIAEPNGTLAVGLTFFPTTSFLVLMLRRAMGWVPPWQIVIAWLVLVAATVLMLIAAARIFRLWMLRYGQGLSLRRLRTLLRGGRHA